MTDCNICCEKLNNSNRKEVTCVFCDYVICRTCFQRYITETSLDPHCMSCKKDFNHDFVVANCTSAFITKDLKKHRENILLQREKALLPETQPYVVIEHQRRDLNKVIRDLNDKKYELIDPKGTITIIELNSNLYSKVWKGIINRINTSTI